MNELSVLEKQASFSIISAKSLSGLLECSSEQLKSIHPSRLFVQFQNMAFTDIEDKGNLPGRLKLVKVILQRSVKNPLLTSPKIGRLKQVSFDSATMADLISQTYLEATATRMSFVNQSDRQNTLVELTADMAGNNCLALSYNEKTVAIVVNRDVLFAHKHTNLVAWIWIDKTLSLDLRISCQHVIDDWLNSFPRELTIASVHPENERSLKFFKRLGFSVAYLGYAV